MIQLRFSFFIFFMAMLTVSGIGSTVPIPNSVPVPIFSSTVRAQQRQEFHSTSQWVAQSKVFADAASETFSPSVSLISEPQLVPQQVAQLAVSADASPKTTAFSTSESPSILKQVAQATVPSDASSTKTIASTASLIEGMSGMNTEEIERFCSNIGSQAADARFQLQRQQLQQLRDQISERVKTLEEKQQEYETWLKRRNDFISMAEDSLVEVLSKMRPDAAAAQLALMNSLVAASLVLKLSPKVSSTIMNELPPEKSAELTQILVSAQQFSARKNPVN
ncbi:hypothetical protein H704_01026 [Bartonella bacilliformis Peru38]|uniref:Uncharacterized protein n=2 Tax=Bartonella bacilliformis TaxID=774 RepID=A0ABN0IES6_BARBA|nr:hypothetical protein BbINS_05352 [Bartonella bacilliformis INS]EYS88625.1 hypothetical protein X472_01176 [Bartonella bacilliformis San Pedro600-02]EYS94397.1 hypothetical protein X470_01101 [Bartonella bacilliformis Peru-18]KEG15884.1 hypothetical protein H709_01000 [Bartonella bacilliformis CUSCO5]KEG19787.1 hypothetical protein H704_01026 [Bartonella bacilliformis Peru38]KEG22191.1 hypothetical protein H703_01016 [Bartonella bacilliformis Ver075]KZM37496.1 hypothetical protein AWH67_049